MALNLIAEVKELMDIIVEEDRQENTWQWLEKWVPILSRPNPLIPSHVAQILLLGETTMWDLPRWRETKGFFRNWEDGNSFCITKSTAYAQIHELCVEIENTGKASLTFYI
jgi:hypothetical protein